MSSGGFLGLAYLAEISIVFNIAYSELRSDRYFEKAEKTIQILRDKIGNGSTVEREKASLYTSLDNIDNKSDNKARRAAWSCCEQNGIWSKICSFVLPEYFYPFFKNRHDKNLIVWCVSITTIILFAATLLDHFEHSLNLSSNAYVWCTLLTLLTICLIYPVVTIILGRSMQARLEDISKFLQKEFNKIIDTDIQNAIQRELDIAEKEIYGRH